MTQASQSHKAAILMAMKLIRPVFHEHGYNLDGYSNNAVADALLEGCPEMNAFWLSQEHLRLTFRRLKKGPESSTFFSPWLRALGFSQRNTKPRPRSG